MLPEEITQNNQTQTIPYYIENHSNADYERWFAARVQGHYLEIYFADARFSEGVFWREVTIDFSGVFIECIRTVRRYKIEWLTPDDSYYAMLGRFMALVSPALAPDLMDYVCRFEFHYDDSPTITVKGAIFANPLAEVDAHAQDVARAVAAIWPQVVALFNDAIPSLSIKEL